uniref:LRAT domain-containing protein n=1 Tax=Alexandrium monilatum TaxID=311494 RepID=A0A7S4VTC9_9DINO
MGSSQSAPPASLSSNHSSASSRTSSGAAGQHAALPPGVRLDDSEVQGVEFVEKSVLACPLPAKAWIELGRWNPVSLLMLAPVWSYHLSGPADHWWFVARSSDHTYYYVAQFCASNGENHITGYAFLGMWAAIASGLQYPEANWWYAREWRPCERPRCKEDLDGLVLQNPAVEFPYSWVDNNCQHFAVHLYEGAAKHSA